MSMHPRLGALLLLSSFAGTATARPAETSAESDESAPDSEAAGDDGVKIITTTPRTEEEIERDYAEAAPQTECETYEMLEYTKTYTTPFVQMPGAWGHHALLWKGFRYLSVEPNGGYNDSQANSLGVPTWDIECGDEAVLDNRELASSQLYDDGSGGFDDPDGSWICVTEDDAESGAIVAALGIHYWGTPTYLDVHGFEATNGTHMAEAVIEKVTLCNTAGTDEPHEVCGWDTGTPADALANLGSCAGALALDSVEISYWGQSPTYGYFPHLVVDGADWDSIYGEISSSGNSTDLILDPPGDASEEDIAAIQELAEDTGSEVLILVDGELVYANSESESAK